MKFMNSIRFDLQVQNWNLMNIWRKSLYNYLPSCRTRSRTRWTCPNERGRNMSNHLQRVLECVRFSGHVLTCPSLARFRCGHVEHVQKPVQKHVQYCERTSWTCFECVRFFWTRSNVSNRPDTFKRVQNVSKICDEHKCLKNKVLSQVHEK